MEEKTKKKIIPQEELYSYAKLKSKDMQSTRSALYYTGIILLNIFFLALAWVLVGNKDGVVGFNQVVTAVDWKNILFIFLIVALILIIQVFPDYMFYYSKTKKRKFGTLFLANAKMNFYNSVTLFSSGGYYMFANRLVDDGATSQSALDTAYFKKFISKISQIVYSFLAIIVGAILFLSKTNIWLIIGGIIGFSINCIAVVFVLIFDTHRDKVLSCVAGLCKTLYRLKFIKDYEDFYNRLVSKLFVYNSNLKFAKKSTIIHILLNVLIQFLRHFVLFIILQMLNFGDLEVLLEILFKCAIIDLIIGVLPLQNGTAIFELLFVSLFNNVFFSGYLLWGMVLYRFFDYFIYLIIYLFVLPFDSKKRKSDTNTLKNTHTTQTLSK